MQDQLKDKQKEELNNSSFFQLLAYILTSDIMRINLMYNYNFVDPNIYIDNNKIYIYEKHKKYMLQEVNNFDELKEINRLIITNRLQSNYFNIIKTKKNELTIKYDNKEYVLLEIRNCNYITKNIELTNNILNRSKIKNSLFGIFFILLLYLHYLILLIYYVQYKLNLYLKMS